MVNKVYVKEGMGSEGIMMKQGGGSNGLKRLLVIILMLAVLGLLGFGAVKFFGSNKIDEKKPVNVLPTSAKSAPSDTPIPTASISALPSKKVTPSPSKKLSPTLTPKVLVTPTPSGAKVSKSLTVAVENGSGEKGAASKMATALTNAGYTVSRTGNADAFTYTGIKVQIKKNKQSSLEQLKKDLSASNYLVTKSTSDLPESESVDVVVIVGSE